MKRNITFVCEHARSYTDGRTGKAYELILCVKQIDLTDVSNSLELYSQL